MAYKKVRVKVEPDTTSRESGRFVWGITLPDRLFCRGSLVGRSDMVITPKYDESYPSRKEAMIVGKQVAREIAEMFMEASRGAIPRKAGEDK